MTSTEDSQSSEDSEEAEKKEDKDAFQEGEQQQKDKTQAELKPKERRRMTATERTIKLPPLALNNLMAGKNNENDEN